MKFTYGYIREATLAQLDIDEEEAQAMNLLERFHIFANEAMQAICATKPKYEYVDVLVGVESKGSTFSINVGDTISMNYDFISFADKAAFKFERLPQCHNKIEKVYVDGDEYTYTSANTIIFHKEGHYLIPCKKLWYVFESGISDETELDMPADILLTIPLYIAAVCLQIDNMQKAQIKKTEFEVALARCANPDFMPMKRIKRSW